MRSETTRIPSCEYYIAQLDEHPWHDVPEGPNLVCHGLWDADGRNLEFPPGSRILHGYLWSRRDTAKRHYELWNDSFERRHRSRPNTGAAWQGFPHIYFPTSMLLHVGFHLQPVIAQTRGAGRVSTWGQLESEDRDMIIAAVSD